jgi:hypothetical protein
MSESEQLSPDTARFERFLEFARPGGQFHPNFCSLIEESLYNDPFTENQLQDLAKKGEHGTLVAIVLAFAYGRFPEPEWAIAVHCCERRERSVINAVSSSGLTISSAMYPLTGKRLYRSVINVVCGPEMNSIL